MSVTLFTPSYTPLIVPLGGYIRLNLWVKLNQSRYLVPLWGYNWINLNRFDKKSRMVGNNNPP